MPHNIPHSGISVNYAMTIIIYQHEYLLPEAAKICYTMRRSSICGMNVKSSKLKRHIKRMHAKRKEYHAHLTNALDPEDIQRERYGDW
jgi:hypothetical protein